MSFAGNRVGACLSLLAAALAIGVASVACGGDGEADRTPAPRGSDEQQVRAAIERMGARIEAGDTAAACEQMTRTGQERFAAIGERLARIDDSFAARGGGGGSCADALGAILSGDVTEDYTPPIASVRVDGDRAVVLAKSSHDERGELQRATLRREDGRWKVARWYEN